MTSSLHLDGFAGGANSQRALGRLRRRGFTLIELLVVMGIILLLISILLPAINKAYKESVRTRMAADLQVISEALDAYKDQNGDYPRSGSNPSVPGAVILSWALIAPGPATQDGADGPGFRFRGTQGQVYGPYLPVDRFRIGVWAGGNSTSVNTPGGNPPTYDDTQTVIADRYGNVILYFPSNRQYPPQNAYVNQWTPGSTAKAMYNYGDNSGYNLGSGNNHLTQKAFAYRLGAHANPSGNPATLSASDTATSAAGAPYILWSPGPDGLFGPQVSGNQTTGQDDDVTNVPLDISPAGFVP